MRLAARCGESKSAVSAAWPSSMMSRLFATCESLCESFVSCAETPLSSSRFRTTISFLSAISSRSATASPLIPTSFNGGEAALMIRMILSLH